MMDAKRFRRIEMVALAALAGLVTLVIRNWDAVQKAHQRTHNTLGQMAGKSPTAELFLWASFAAILYFGTRFWSALAPHVFELPDERAPVWRERLLWVRLGSTLLFLGLTLFTIYRA